MSDEADTCNKLLSELKFKIDSHEIIDKKTYKEIEQQIFDAKMFREYCDNKIHDDGSSVQDDHIVNDNLLEPPEVN